MSFTNVYRLPPGIIRHCFNPGPVRVIPVLSNTINSIGQNCACLSSNNCTKHTVNTGLKVLQPTNKRWFMKDTPLLPRLSGVPGSVKLTGNAVTPFSAGALKTGKESGGEKHSLNNLWSCYPEKSKQSSADLKNETGDKSLVSEYHDSGNESLSESESEGAITPDNVFITNWDNLGQESFLVQKKPELPGHTNDLSEQDESGKHNPFRVIVAENAGTFSDKRAWQFGEKFDNYYPGFEVIIEEPSSLKPVEEVSITQETVLIIGEKLKMQSTQNIFGIKREDLYQEESTRL